MLACTALVGCTNDDSPVNNNDVEKAGREYKTRVRIVMPSVASSRAQDPGTEFDGGTATEAAIKTAKFAFYDMSGAYLGYSVGNFTADNTAGADENVEKEIEVTIETEKTPSKVVAFINPNATIDAAVQGKSLSDLKSYVVKAGEINLFESTSNNGFFMVNSSYVEGSNIIQETTFPTNALVDITDGEPTTWPSTALVEIYVERLAAKVSVTASALATNNETVSLPNSKTGYIVTDESKVNAPIVIEITGWGLNNTNDDLFVIKPVQTTWPTAWNGDYRLYWGKDNDYAGTETYITGTNFGTDNSIPTGLALNAPTTEAKLTTAIGGVEYCAPNTIGANYPLNSYTEAVVAAKYYHYDGTNVKALATGERIYSIDNKIYTGGNSAATDLKKVIADMLFIKGGFYYVSNTDANTIADATQIAATDIEIEAGTSYNNHAFVKGTIKLATGKYLYKLDEEASTETAKSYNKVEDPATLLGSLFGNSTIYIYTDGICYYQIPIRQFPNTATIKEGDEGYYGVVRNHSYVIDITKIEGLGDPTTPDAPIFNDGEDTARKYKMKATIKSLGWAVVKQNTVLK